MLFYHNHGKSILDAGLTTSQKNKLKKYLAPYSEIETLRKIKQKYENKIGKLSRQMREATNEIETLAKKMKIPLQFEASEELIDLKNTDYLLKIYNPKELIIATGITNDYPGSAYLDVDLNNIYILSSKGILGYSKNILENIDFEQIRHNLSDYIAFDKNRSLGGDVSFKDIKVFNGKVYLSLTQEIEKDCWNTSLLEGDLDFDYIDFKPLFIPNKCVDARFNESNEFQLIQSGGRITKLDDKHILLSIGDYRSRNLSQDDNSVNGKSIKINLITKDFSIFSKGHRNQQGLFFDDNNNYVITTEHGPKGGDELNIIEMESNEIPNYGWPISSYGEHYSGKNDYLKYKKYPLHKNHEKYGFVEPIKYFTPSIGISDILAISPKKEYALASLRDKGLYIINLNSINQIENLQRLEIGERIRDLALYKNKLLLYLEDTASIGIIDLGKESSQENEI